MDEAGVARTRLGSSRPPRARAFDLGSLRVRAGAKKGDWALLFRETREREGVAFGGMGSAREKNKMEWLEVS